MSRAVVAISGIDPYYINTSEAIELLRKNRQFYQLIKTGKFVYVDNHFCLKEEKYLKKEGRNIIGLSAYARKTHERVLHQHEKLSG